MIESLIHTMEINSHGAAALMASFTIVFVVGCITLYNIIDVIVNRRK